MNVQHPAFPGELPTKDEGNVIVLVEFQPCSRVEMS